MRHKMSPILLPNGQPDYARVMDRFRDVASAIDAGISRFVEKKIRGAGGDARP